MGPEMKTERAHKKGNSERTIFKLTHAQSYRLTSWIDAQRHRIDTERLSLEKIAEGATKILEFQVTASSVRTSCQTLGIKTFHTAARGSNKGKIAAALQKQIDQLKTGFEQLLAAVTAPSSKLEQLGKDHQTLAAAFVNAVHRIGLLEKKAGIVTNIPKV